MCDYQHKIIFSDARGLYEQLDNISNCVFKICVCFQYTQVCLIKDVCMSSLMDLIDGFSDNKDFKSAPTGFYTKVYNVECLVHMLFMINDVHILVTNLGHFISFLGRPSSLPED